MGGGGRRYAVLAAGRSGQQRAAHQRVALPLQELQMAQEAPLALPRALDVQRFAGAREQEVRDPSLLMHDTSYADGAVAAATGP